MSLQTLWYGRSPLAWLLLPWSVLFALATAIRRGLYRNGMFKTIRVDQPVIVVGNISVGGTGKTPLVIWLVQALTQRGFKPAVIARGYGGDAGKGPRDVTRDSDPARVGDEAVLIAMRTEAITVACADRVRAARRAIERGANVIVSDDGLQHYRLARDVEVAVVDDARRFGNGFLLPAGPLRESPQRLRGVDAVVRTLRGADGGALGFSLEVGARIKLNVARSLLSGEERPLTAFAGTRVHALAGIGNPDAFFSQLRAFGMDVDPRPLADHATVRPTDVQFADEAPVLMTEKDAVKCRAFADARLWSVPAIVELDGEHRLLDMIVRKLDSSR